MASLPPISADNYAQNVATSFVTSKSETAEAASSSEAVRPSLDEELSDESNAFDEAQINNCLFCTKDSGSLETNLEHMSSEHGLYIPEIEHLSSSEIILEYLRTVITKYNECLYCGMIKQSAEGIRRHMLDKGHCMINLEREPELLEFWEFSDSEGDDSDEDETPKSQARKTGTAATRDLSQGEYVLPSGKVVASKSKARVARLFARRTALAAKETSNRMVTEGPTNTADTTGTTSSADPSQSLIRTLGGTQGALQGGIKDRAVAVRDAAGLIGVSDQQIRSLVTMEKKTQRQAALVRASAAWAGELGGTHQKHFKTKMSLRDG
jgi:pre-60S factor REI1